MHVILLAVGVARRWWKITACGEEDRSNTDAVDLQAKNDPLGLEERRKHVDFISGAGELPPDFKVVLRVPVARI
jgi:hypothetical protein